MATGHLTAAGESAGFSLVELLVAMAIMTMIVGSMLMITTSFQRSYHSRLDSAGVQQEARYALDWITRELTPAGSNAANITVSACPAAGNTFRVIRRDPNADGVQNDIRFHADVNPPNGLLGGAAGACTEAGEDITVGYDAANLAITRRDNNVDAAPVAMSDGVITQLGFAYLNSNRVVTATDAAVAFVRVTVSARTPRADPNTGQPTTFTLTTDVRVRTR